MKSEAMNFVSHYKNLHLTFNCDSNWSKLWEF